jgi:hypothetical protein
MQTHGAVKPRQSELEAAFTKSIIIFNRRLALEMVSFWVAAPVLSFGLGYLSLRAF